MNQEEMQQRVDTVLGWLKDYLNEPSADADCLVMFLEIKPLLANAPRTHAALIDLLDEQNGPPLISQEESWDIAMNEATTATEDTEQKMNAALAEPKQTEPPAA